MGLSPPLVPLDLTGTVMHPVRSSPRVDLTAARSQGVAVQNTSQTDVTASEPRVQRRIE